MSIIESKEDYACIIDNLLYYGNLKPALHDEELSKIGIKAIVSILSPKRNIPHDENKFTVLNINTEDKVNCSLNDWGEKVANFIEENINNNKPVYVHCAQGISRSTSAILYYLMEKKGMNLKDSFNLVKSKRNVACPTIGFFKDLIEFDKKLFGKNSINLAEYSIMMLKENFPSLDIQDIEKVYYKYQELYMNGEKKDEYKNEMENNNYEPIGYHTLDELLNGIGKGKFFERKGGSTHHPFD